MHWFGPFLKHRLVTSPAALGIVRFFLYGAFYLLFKTSTSSSSNGCNVAIACGVQHQVHWLHVAANKVCPGLSGVVGQLELHAHLQNGSVMGGSVAMGDEFIHHTSLTKQNLSSCHLVDRIVLTSKRIYSGTPFSEHVPIADTQNGPKLKGY